MRVKDLINELKGYDEDMDVVIKPSNSTYVDDIYSTDEDRIRSFHGDDFNAIIIYGSDQCGAC